MAKKKTKTGRPKLPAAEKRTGVTIYPRLETILKYGGMANLRTHLLKQIEDENS